MGLKVEMGKHGLLINIIDGKQSHHLNQNAAFGTLIPRNEGAAIKLSGNAMLDIDSDHYRIHYVMERFWDQFRRTGHKRKSGKKYEAGIMRPTVGQYNKMLTNALAATSLSAEEQCKALSFAKQSQADYGIKEEDLVPNIPRPLGQTREVKKK